MNITKPSIVRLLRKAGVKSTSDSCYIEINGLIEKKIEEIVVSMMVVNSESQIKTLMVNDLYSTLRLLGVNLAVTDDMYKSTCSK